jgi:hypothetical protein
LIEPLGEKEKIVRALARWEGAARVGARLERIENKMGEAQCGLEEHKKYTCGARRSGGMGEYLCEAKVYSCFLARARGL